MPLSLNTFCLNCFQQIMKEVFLLLHVIWSELFALVHPHIQACPAFSAAQQQLCLDDHAGKV